jgi:hypothetical protein
MVSADKASAAKGVKIFIGQTSKVVQIKTRILEQARKKASGNDPEACCKS